MRKLLWVLAASAVGWAVAVSGIENNPAFAAFLALVAVCFFIAGLGEARLRDWRRKAPVLFIASAAVIGAIVFAFGAYLVGRPGTGIADDEDVKDVSPPISEAATALFMETRMTGLPLRIPVGAVAHIVSLNKKRITSASSADWGFYVVPNDRTTERLWPDERVIKAASAAHNAAMGSVWRADVSNHGPTTVLDVSIPLTLTFENDKPVIHRAIVSPLAPGETFTFYLINDCPKGVAGVWPDSVGLLVLGEKTRRNVPLRRKFKSPIDQFMVFFPATTQLVGDSQCE